MIWKSFSAGERGRLKKSKKEITMEIDDFILIERLTKGRNFANEKN
jgi:hypothetical protein